LHKSNRGAAGHSHGKLRRAPCLPTDLKLLSSKLPVSNFKLPTPGQA
jgi:hypothetical protein